MNSKCLFVGAKDGGGCWLPSIGRQNTKMCRRLLSFSSHFTDLMEARKDRQLYKTYSIFPNYYYYYYYNSI